MRVRRGWAGPGQGRVWDPPVEVELLSSEALDDADVVTECLFRSPAELTEQDQLGELIPEPV